MSTVHSKIKEYNSKEEGAQYPTTLSLHEAIMKIEGMPKWGKTTTHRLLI